MWLRDYPLSREEVRERESKAAVSVNVLRKKDWGEPSKHYCSVTDCNHKGRVAETAVAFRLALLGLPYYKGESTESDFIVSVEGRLVTLQVKWASDTVKSGLPMARVRRSQGRRNNRAYLPGEFDFLAVYSLYNDTVYVYTADEVIGKKINVTVSPDAAENWAKLKECYAV